MKIIFWLLILLYSHFAMAQNTLFKVNHEVFKCGGEVSYPIRFEAQNSFYKHNQLDTLSDTSLEEAIKQLAAISPSRASVLTYLAQESKRVSYLPGVFIQRSSPTGILLTPKNCTVEIISELSFRNKQGFVIIQKDLFDKLSLEDKVLFWFNLSLDYIQTMHILTFQDGNFDLISGKEFTACWFSSDCRPRSVNEMNRLVLDKDYRLFYFEQDHYLVERDERNVTFYPNGFIRAFKSYYNLTTIDKEIQNAFKSRVELQDQSSEVWSLGEFARPQNIFHEDGSIGCAYPFKGSTYNAKLSPLAFDVFYEDSSWIPSPIFQFRFPLCWTADRKITQGFLIENEEKPLVLSFHGHELRIDSSNEYSVEKFKGSAFHFYPDGKLHRMFNSIGKVALNGRSYAIKGISIFQPDGKLQCAQFAEDVSFVSKAGEVYECHSEGNRECRMACFDEDEIYTGKSVGIELFFIMKDLDL